MGLTNAERQQRYRDSRKAGKPAVQYRRPKDRRTRPQRWADAVIELRSMIEEYRDWRENLPEPLQDGYLADKLDAVIELESAVDALDAAELPLGFGRD
jgi:hypothetical protein